MRSLSTTVFLVQKDISDRQKTQSLPPDTLTELKIYQTCFNCGRSSAAGPAGGDRLAGLWSRLAERKEWEEVERKDMGEKEKKERKMRDRRQKGMERKGRGE